MFIIENTKKTVYPKGPGTPGPPNHINYYGLGTGGLDCLQICTLSACGIRLAVEEKIGKGMDADSNVWRWLVEYAADTFNRYKIGGPKLQQPSEKRYCSIDQRHCR